MMNIAVYAYEIERGLLHGLLEAACSRYQRRPVVQFFGDYDSFIQGLPGSRSDLVLVVRDGADGMEGANAARDLLPRTPLAWFSDDRGFGPQSYRVGCGYFGTRPVTAEQVETALMRCGLVGRIPKQEGRTI